jgi:Uma2 family endonuclease
MMLVASRPITLPADYLEAELTATQKHELHEGQVLAMSGWSANHGELCEALSEFRQILKGKRCRPLGSETKVVVTATGSYYYPDATISCPPHYVDRKNGVIDNPTVIFEVLSPSTEAFDRGAKFRAYEQLDSLKEYVLISAEQPLIESFRRQPDGLWLRQVVEGIHANLDLPSVEASIPLATLYADVVFDAE